MNNVVVVDDSVALVGIADDVDVVVVAVVLVAVVDAVVSQRFVPDCISSKSQFFKDLLVI